MASIRQRGKYFFIDYRINGKRVRKHAGTSEKEALAALQKIKEQLAQSRSPTAAKSASFNHLFDQFRSYCQDHLSVRTRQRYGSILVNFQRFLNENLPGIKSPSLLTASQIKGYIRFRKGEGAKDRTVNAELIVLRMMFRFSVRWGMINQNPLDDLDLLDVKSKEPPRFLTKEECRKLLSQAGDWFYPVLYTFLHTGMRRGELENLRWEDLDWQRRVIRIRPRRGFVKREFEREIPLSPGLYGLLSKIKAQGSKSPYVFTYKNKKRIPANYIRNHLMGLAKRCGCPDVTQVQSLRYTFGAELVKKGMDLVSVRQLMGHSDKDTALLYGKFARENVEKVIKDIGF